MKGELFIVGVGPGQARTLTLEAIEKIERATRIFCSDRLLDASFLPEGVKISSYQGRLDQVSAWIENSRTTDQTVVLVSGDPGFYSLSRKLLCQFPEAVVVPGISAFQYLFARIGRSWEQYDLVSLHGSDNAWLERYRAGRSLVLLTDPDRPPHHLITQLVAAGHGHTRVTVGCQLGSQEEVIDRGSAVALLGKPYDPLAVVIVDAD